MKIKTRQFGEVEIDDDKIITIPLGIPGFRNYKKFVLMQKEETVPFLLFQCLEEADLSFVVLDPVQCFPEYSIEEKDLKKLVEWVFDKEEISVFVIVTIPNGIPEKMTANFMAPLVINNNRKQGLQLILENSTYSHQHQLLK